MSIVVKQPYLEEILGKYELKKTGVKVLDDRVYLYHKKELFIDKDKKEVCIPSVVVYKIVNTFFKVIKENPNTYTPCLDAWLLDGAKKDFHIYALVARRYNFSYLKLRSNKWYENGKLVVVNNNGSQYSIKELK